VTFDWESVARTVMLAAAALLFLASVRRAMHTGHREDRS
jgi:hypothetical protein